ncbi:MAG TPA: D-aminoacyl-tRNA deacylase [Actinomycetota bacterium]|nr:D-aminoacyl-tRNA deacylase [Actinomycetota bacterium]
MRAVIQRVSRASVSVGGDLVGEIGSGFLVLLGAGRGDGEAEALHVADKIANLRVIQDGDGKMNLSLLDVQGEVLVVSQFTLYADTSRGRRPSFVDAAPPEEAEPLVERVAARLTELGLRVACGVFGASMDVELVNRGPVTILIDTARE